MQLVSLIIVLPVYGIVVLLVILQIFVVYGTSYGLTPLHSIGPCTQKARSLRCMQRALGNLY